MSVVASTWAWKVTGLHQTEKLALLALADWSDDDGVSFPSLKKLAAKVETSQRNIIRVVHKLEDKGLLVIKKRPAANGDHYSNQYHLSMDGVVTPTSLPSDTHDTRGSDTRVTRGSDIAVAHNTSLPDTSLPDTPPNPQGGIHEVRVVFDYWRALLNHPGARLDDQRDKRIRKALKAFSIEELRLACIGITHSDWHMGRDPKNPKVFDAISNVFKDAQQIESFIALAAKHGNKPRPVANTTSSKRRVLG